MLANRFALSDEDSLHCSSLISAAEESARVIRRAEILLKLHRGRNASAVSRELGIARGSVYNVCKRYCEGGLEKALYDASRPGGRRKFDDETFEWVRQTASQHPSSLGIDAPHWTFTLFQDYLKTHAAEAGYPLAANISRSRLWDILPNRESRCWHQSRQSGTASQTEVLCFTATIPIRKCTDGLWRPSYGTSGSVIRDEVEEMTLAFIICAEIEPGRLFACAGSKLQRGDLAGMLAHLQDKVGSETGITVFEPASDMTIPGRLADIVRSDFPKITVADAAQFGTLVSTVHRFALNMIQLCTKPLSAPSPYVLQEAISAAIEKSV